MLSLMEQHQGSFLQSFYQFKPTPRLSHFKKEEVHRPKSDKAYIALWESLITGRSQGIPKEMKSSFQNLGLIHLFTPSGFHLSAVLTPLKFLIRSKTLMLIILVIMSSLCFFLVSGQEALKRMCLIKVNQHLLGQGLGFGFALGIDILRGGLSNSPLSFFYSVLFLSLIYFKIKNLVWWFFAGQCLIMFFQEGTISVLNLVFSPIINLLFSLCLPILMLLAIPIWKFQIDLGINILKFIDHIITFFNAITLDFVRLEVTLLVLILFTAIYLRKKKVIYLCLLFYQSNLNLDYQRINFKTTWEIVPDKAEEHLYCERNLVRGIWWEKCSSRKRSTGNAI